MNDSAYLRMGPGVVSYRVKVAQAKDATYLWGGTGVTEPVALKGLFLLIRNDPKGEEISLSTALKGAPLEPICTLKAGEVTALQVNTVIAIVAACDYDSYVDCALISSPLG
jgi:hypothetical protein